MSLNVIEQSRITRTMAGLYERLQRAEAYFAGVTIPTVRIGDAVITNAKIANLSVTTAKIANATIENAKFDTLDASKITADTLDADRIGAGTIVASKLSVSTLSAITANLGSVNAGSVSGVTVTGGTVRTNSSSSRVEMSSSPERFTVWDSGNRRIVLGGGVIIFYGTSAVRLSNGGNLLSQWDASSSSFNFISTSASQGILINNDGSGDIYIVANDIVNLNAPTVRLDTGSKSAILPLAGGYRSVYCAEAPDIWFMDFHKKKIDPMFEEVTEGQSYEFKCIDGTKLTLRHRKGFEKVRFQKKTSIEAERNQRRYA